MFKAQEEHLAMAKGKQHRSQHFVPRCYTAAWVDREVPPKMEPYVWIFGKNSREGRRKAPRNIFEETDFYTTEGEGGSRDLGVEKGLGVLESNFVKARAKVERHQKLSMEEHAYLMAFVAAMEGRTKSQRDHQRQQWGRVKELMDLMIAEDPRIGPEERRARIERPPSYGAREGGTTYEDLKRFLEYPMGLTISAMIQSMAPILARMHLLVFETDDQVGFITSDAPCVVVDPAAYRRGPMYRSAGLGYKTTEVSMALSPRQLLVFTHHEGADGFAEADSVVLGEFNRRTRVRCYEHYIVRMDQTLDAWFEKREDPPDSWEKTHPRETVDEEPI